MAMYAEVGRGLEDLMPIARLRALLELSRRSTLADTIWEVHGRRVGVGPWQDHLRAAYHAEEDRQAAEWDDIWPSSRAFLE